METVNILFRQGSMVVGMQRIFVRRNAFQYLLGKYVCVLLHCGAALGLSCS